MAAGPLRQGASLRSGGGEREEAAPDWASLHVELTQLISVRVLATGGFLDYLRFRAVCSHWRAAAASPRGRTLLDPRFHPRRWMLFPESFGRFPGHRALGGHSRFFDFSAAGPIVRVPLPELKDHCVLDSPDGLLLLQHDGDNAVRLLHPFTRDVAEFPDLKCLTHQLYEMDYELTDGWYNNFASWLQNTARYLYQARKLSAAVNVTATGAVTVMLALHSIGRVAFASAGYAEWTISSWKMNQLDRALSYQGKLYVVNWEDGLTHVLQIDPPQLVPQCKGEEDSSPVLALLPPKTIATCSSEEIHLPYLVELDSEIMLVGYNDSSFSHILVLKLADLVLGRTVRVKSIGDHILFVGARSLCVSPSWLPSIGGNSIEQRIDVLLQDGTQMVGNVEFEEWGAQKL
ncbi:unnamed protein product [Miscanthus lutarioriparius]|uniref:KIB1-4 beta-propeller domain-containing protein n=1 Tax=Miscanthus lutarioriparius TaxID=422564 RepID=A0A811NFD1_9POAL|nr:unnamed protein product [Miscanthus lutarioriparius]